MNTLSLSISLIRGPLPHDLFTDYQTPLSHKISPLLSRSLYLWYVPISSLFCLFSLYAFCYFINFIFFLLHLLLASGSFFLLPLPSNPSPSLNLPNSNHLSLNLSTQIHPTKPPRPTFKLTVSSCSYHHQIQPTRYSQPNQAQGPLHLSIHLLKPLANHHHQGPTPHRQGVQIRISQVDHLHHPPSIQRSYHLSRQVILL